LLATLAACAPTQTPPSVPAPAGTQDLPAEWFPAQQPTSQDLVVFLMTGDGNLAPADRAIVDAITERGVPVVALRSRDYLRSGHITPERAAQDAGRLLSTALKRWHGKRWAFIGYSRGAIDGPFIINRLASPLRKTLTAVTLLGTLKWASFTFHWIDMLRDVHRPDDLAVAPELEKLEGLPILCIYGTEDDGVLCPHLPPGLATITPRPGGHQIDHPETVIPPILDQLGLIANRGDGP
jgi:type IV secretory pathway VirJ component